LWLGSLLAPVSALALFLLNWLRERREIGPGCDFIPCPTPWYMLFVGYLFYIGLIIALLAVVRTTIDFIKSKRGRIV
jgi:cytochrome b561